MPFFDDDLVRADDSAEFHSFNEELSDSSTGSPSERERQISIDPISLKKLSRKGSKYVVDRPPVLAQQPTFVKSKFLSCSLPGSAASSPKFSSTIAKNSKKWHNAAPQPHLESSSFADKFFALSQNSLCRSKSLGEGRSSVPSDDLFDILARRPSIRDDAQRYEEEDGEETTVCDTTEKGSLKNPPQLVLPGRPSHTFRCRCLLLPGLSHKMKQVVQRKPKRTQVNKPASPQEVEEEFSFRPYPVRLVEPQDKRESPEKLARESTASLEKFDCGSWSSSAILDGDGDEESSMHYYFDLPLELIRSGQSGTNSPVKTAFVFDRDVKGVLKKSNSKLSLATTREMSNRHVRFSTSLPTSYPSSPSSACVTPRLRKAREEFNAFLEAQSA